MRDVCGQVLDSSRGLGMTGEKGVGWLKGVMDATDVLRHETDGPPPPRYFRIWLWLTETQW